MRSLGYFGFAGCLGLFALFAPSAARAQQLVTFDQVVTITEKGNGSGAFHYTIKPAATEPASWTTPVDYSKGTAHVHLEVMEKPSKRNTAITICFDGNLEGYGCIATSTYTDVGVYDTARNLPGATWQYNKIAWNRRRQEYHLVVKDPALGGTPGGRPASDYVPTKMRIVMTIVPPGGTYTPPMGVASPATDAGASQPPADAGAPSASDAGASPPGEATVDASPSPMPTPTPPSTPASDAAASDPTPARDAAPSSSSPPSSPPSSPSGNGNRPSGSSSGNPPPGQAGEPAPATGGCTVSGTGSNPNGGWLSLVAGALVAIALGRRRG